MQSLAGDYLRRYQQCMFDRTDEGMLASYWMVAGQYAYRYAYPERHKSTGLFYSGPVAGRPASGEEPGEIKVLAPQAD